MSLIPSAMETVPDMAPAPADSQPMTLQDHLDAAIALMARDGMMTPDEQQAVVNFMQQAAQLGQGMQQAGAPTPMDQMAREKMAQGGFGGPGGDREVSPYGQSTRPGTEYQWRNSA